MDSIGINKLANDRFNQKKLLNRVIIKNHIYTDKFKLKSINVSFRHLLLVLQSYSQAN